MRDHELELVSARRITIHARRSWRSASAARRRSSVTSGETLGIVGVDIGV
jgi:hypothetical protein